MMTNPTKKFNFNNTTKKMKKLMRKMIQKKNMKKKKMKMGKMKKF